MTKHHSESLYCRSSHMNKQPTRLFSLQPVERSKGSMSSFDSGVSDSTRRGKYVRPGRAADREDKDSGYVGSEASRNLVPGLRCVLRGGTARETNATMNWGLNYKYPVENLLRPLHHFAPSLTQRQRHAPSPRARRMRTGNTPIVRVRNVSWWTLLLHAKPCRVCFRHTTPGSHARTASRNDGDVALVDDSDTTTTESDDRSTVEFVKPYRPPAAARKKSGGTRSSLLAPFCVRFVLQAPQDSGYSAHPPFLNLKRGLGDGEGQTTNF